MKKRIVALLMAVVMVGALAGCAATDQSADTSVADTSEAQGEDETSSADEEAATDGDTIKIGLVSMITGDNPLNGERMNQGVQLAVDEVNAAGETSSVSKTVTITAETAFVKFYIRMFVRSDNPDTPALLKFYVNGELLRGVGAASDSILVSSDNYRCLAYDLSAYIGQTIEIKLESEQGQHAAIGKILMADDCTIAETRKLYSTDEVRAM